MGKYSKLVKLYLFLITICFSTFVHAIELGEVGAGFDVNQANTKLDEVSTILDQDSVVSGQLYNSLQMVKNLQEKAKECADASEVQLKKIDSLLGDKSVGAALRANPREYNYIKQRHEQVAKYVAACKIFVMQADQVLTRIAKSLRHNTQVTSGIIKSTPVWGIISDDVVSQFSVSTEKLYLESGIERVAATEYMLLLVLLVVTLVICTWIYSICGKILKNDADIQHLRNHTAKITRRYIFILLPITTIAVFLHFLLFDIEPAPIIVHLSYAALIYTGAIVLADYFLFIPLKGMNNIIGSTIQNRILFRFIVLSTVILLGYLGAVFLRGQELTQQFVDITRISYVTLTIFSMFWLSWVVFKVRYISDHQNSLVTLFAKILFFAVLLSLLTAEWLGYHHTSVYIIKGVVVSSFFLILTWGVILLIESFFSIIGNHNYAFYAWMRRVTNLKSDSSLYEFYLLRVALYVLAAGIFIVGMMQIWGASLYHIDLVKEAWLEGFPVLGMKINPIKISFGIAIFCAINIIGRVYSASIARKTRKKQEIDSQVAIATVINYIAFSIAVVVGLLIAGVNFTGLAIIAGALSVGIGFGLQNIANDILSGIILLIQKPVKSGDRVVVAGIEGFIKRVRVLSTQIKTLDEDDAIIPNHVLLANPISNGMFRDNYWRVICSVGVAYGSDTQLVKKVLLEIAADSPKVENEPPHAPMVLFKAFGDSALIFELWAIIKDVNDKNIMLSELNFEIDKRFRESNIEIAFPQLDIHVKEAVDINPKQGD